MIVGFPSPANGTDFSASVGSVEGREVAVEKKLAYAAIRSAFGFLGPVLGPGFDGGSAGGGSSTFISSLCTIIDR